MHEIKEESIQRKVPGIEKPDSQKNKFWRKYQRPTTGTRSRKNRTSGEFDQKHGKEKATMGTRSSGYDP